MVQISYGSVANTRHSAKHCRGQKQRSRFAITAGSKALGSSVSGSEYRRRECETLAAIHRASLDDREFYMDGRVSMVLKGRDGINRLEVVNEGTLTLREKQATPPQREKVQDYDVCKENVPMFKPLKERSVNCSARGGDNGGTKDRSVSSRVAASPDVDNVSGMTGQVNLSRDGRHKTKVPDSVHLKERTAFMDAIVKHKVRLGLASWMPAVKKANKLRKSALRNSARA
jgi:hypothetical protein